MNACANCGATLQGPFCHACGQAEAEPISIGLIARVISSETLELEGRFVRTVVELTRRPGRAISDYLDGHRIGLYNPGKYLFLTITLSIVMISLLDIDLLSAAQREVLDPDAASAVDLMIAMSAYMNFLVAFLVAIPQALMSHIGPVRRNLAESFVVQLFVQGHVTLPLIVYMLLVPDYAYLSGFLGWLLLLPYTAVVLMRVHAVSALRATIQSFVLFIVYAFVSLVIFGFVQLIGISWFAGSHGAG